MKNWFEVDVKGLRALQEGKPKTFVIRELIQNAWDENILRCKLDIESTNGQITLSVTDDSPEGFRNLRDAYTLFGDTTKRHDTEKRGRFNLGEKQLISICDYCSIETTKGTIVFDKKGRHSSKKCRKTGTLVTIKFKGTKKDATELVMYAHNLIVPSHITYLVNGVRVQSKHILKSFESTLMTEIQKDGFMSKTKRKTKVNLLQEETPILYEMGIPIMDIDCKFSVDVQQKVPLSFDRDSVNQTFLKKLYVQVLNNSYQNLDTENSSDSWIRLAMSGKDVSKDAIQKILENRYGEKFLVANPFDPNSIDDAIANGYHVIKGSEMGKDEWNNIKEHQLIQSTSVLFGHGTIDAPNIEPNQNQKMVERFAKKIANRLMGIDIKVRFVNGGQTMVVAQYGNRTLTFNISRLGEGFFQDPMSPETLKLIIHELGHEKGMHTEETYHRMITELGANLTIMALEEPEFFKEFRMGKVMIR